MKAKNQYRYAPENEENGLDLPAKYNFVKLSSWWTAKPSTLKIWIKLSSVMASLYEVFISGSTFKQSRKIQKIYTWLVGSRLV